MSQNQFPQESQFRDLDPELIKQILDREQQEFRLDEMWLKQNLILAEKIADMNIHIAKSGPAQRRKTVFTYAIIGIVFLLLFLTFILYCLTSGNEAFLKTFLNWISPFLTTIIGFWAGRYSVRPKKMENRRIETIAEAEVVD